MDRHINGSKNNTGRPGLDLWEIFVLSQVRLCLNASYGVIHDLANNHHVMRCVMGIAHEFSYPRIELEYQNIYDNVSKINDPIIFSPHSINLTSLTNVGILWELIFKP